MSLRRARRTTISVRLLKLHPITRRKVREGFAEETHGRTTARCNRLPEEKLGLRAAVALAQRGRTG